METTRIEVQNPLFSNFAFLEKRVTLQSMEPPVQDQADEFEWMHSIAQGDEESLKLLIQKWQKPIYHFFYRFLNQRETAEDLTQSVFIKIYKAAPRYKPQARFSTYIFHIARRVLYNEFRRQKRKPSTGLEDLSPERREMAVQGEDRQPHAEWEEWMSIALQRLPDRQKEVMLLHIQQGLSYEEIAEVMECTMSTIKSLLFRAREALRHLLQQNF